MNSRDFAQVFKRVAKGLCILLLGYLTLFIPSVTAQNLKLNNPEDAKPPLEAAIQQQIFDRELQDTFTGDANLNDVRWRLLNQTASTFLGYTRTVYREPQILISGIPGFDPYVDEVLGKTCIELSIRDGHSLIDIERFDITRDEGDIIFDIVFRVFWDSRLKAELGSSFFTCSWGVNTLFVHNRLDLASDSSFNGGEHRMILRYGVGESGFYLKDRQDFEGSHDIRVSGKGFAPFFLEDRLPIEIEDKMVQDWFELGVSVTRWAQDFVVGLIISTTLNTFGISTAVLTVILDIIQDFLSVIVDPYVSAYIKSLYRPGLVNAFNPYLADLKTSVSAIHMAARSEVFNAIDVGVLPSLINGKTDYSFFNTHLELSGTNAISAEPQFANGSQTVRTQGANTNPSQKLRYQSINNIQEATDIQHHRYANAVRPIGEHLVDKPLYFYPFDVSATIPEETFNRQFDRLLSEEYWDPQVLDPHQRREILVETITSPHLRHASIRISMTPVGTDVPMLSMKPDPNRGHNSVLSWPVLFHVSADYGNASPAFATIPTMLEFALSDKHSLWPKNKYVDEVQPYEVLQYISEVNISRKDSLPRFASRDFAPLSGHLSEEDFKNIVRHIIIPKYFLRSLTTLTTGASIESNNYYGDQHGIIPGAGAFMKLPSPPNRSLHRGFDLNFHHTDPRDSIEVTTHRPRTGESTMHQLIKLYPRREVITSPMVAASLSPVFIEKRPTDPSSYSHAVEFSALKLDIDGVSGGAAFKWISDNARALYAPTDLSEQGHIVRHVAAIRSPNDIYIPYNKSSRLHILGVNNAHLAQKDCISSLTINATSGSPQASQTYLRRFVRNYDDKVSLESEVDTFIDDYVNNCEGIISQ